MDLLNKRIDNTTLIELYAKQKSIGVKIICDTELLPLTPQGLEKVESAGRLLYQPHNYIIVVYYCYEPMKSSAILDRVPGGPAGQSSGGSASPSAPSPGTDCR